MTALPTIASTVRFLWNRITQFVAVVIIEIDSALSPALAAECSTYTRARTLRQMMHSASRSASHAKDKAQAAHRANTTWVPVPAPDRPPIRPLGLEAHEFIRVSGQWVLCTDPEQLGRYLRAEHLARRVFRAPTKRNGREVMMSRRTDNPINILTVTTHPAACEWTADQFAAGKDTRQAWTTIRNGTTKALLRLLGDERELLAIATHTSTRVLHWDYAFSRIRDGRRLGKAGLMLSGPWMVAVSRALWAGAQVSARTRERYERSKQAFQRRYPGDVPLDVRLAWECDKLTAAAIGPEFDHYRAIYAAQVPETEIANLRAELAAIETARARLLGELSQTITSTEQTPCLT